MAQQVAIGSYIYLHRPNRPFNADEFHLLISAHGVVAGSTFRVPDWANLHFYGKHGAALSDPGFREIIEGKYQVFESKMGGETCPDYFVSKYQGRHGNRRETYEKLQEAVQSNSDWLDTVQRLAAAGNARAVKSTLNRQNFAFYFDVLTIRNRYHGITAPMGVKLSWVLAELANHGYRYNQIHCSFCRWRPFGGSVSAPKWGS